MIRMDSLGLVYERSVYPPRNCLCDLGQKWEVPLDGVMRLVSQIIDEVGYIHSKNVLSIIIHLVT